MKLRIEARATATFAAVEEAVKVPLDSAKRLQREILIQLAPLHQLPNSNHEKQLLEEMEHFDWKDSAHNEYCVRAMKCFPNMTRDSGAASQGMMLPSHTYYEAAATQVRKSCSVVEEFWTSVERLLRQLQGAATQSLVTHSDPSDAVSIGAKYERLKVGVLLLGAVLLSIAISAAVEFVSRRWQWHWLLSHPNSYSIQWLSYAVLLLFLIGLLVRRFRKFCWGVALIPLVVAVLQSLGGPARSP